MTDEEGRKYTYAVLVRSIAIDTTTDVSLQKAMMISLTRCSNDDVQALQGDSASSS